MQVAAIIALLLDGITTWAASARGGREANPVFKSVNGFAVVNAALLGFMFWKLDYPQAWAAYGGVHLLAALWNGYQLWRTR